MDSYHRKSRKSVIYGEQLMKIKYFEWKQVDPFTNMV